MIGLNWIIQRDGDDTIVWHNGGTGGYRTFLGLAPSRRIAVVIMTNSAGIGSDDIGMHLLIPAIPLAPAPAAAKAHVAIELPAAELAKFGGRYQLAPGFVLEVRLQNGLVFAQATGQEAFRIWPEKPREFFYKDVNAQITFVGDSAGTITGLVLHQNGATVPAKKIQ
jgi:hypothetical protein